MTRGNQRELARLKNLKKNEKNKNKTKDGRTLLKKKEEDAAIMRAKQQKAEEKRVAEAAATAKGAK